jgi:outer membrane protein assembly factor BamA
MRLFYLSFLVSIAFNSLSQNTFSLAFTTQEYKKVKKNIQTEFKDSISVLNYLMDLRTLAIKKGFLLASVDSVSYSNTSYQSSFFVGDRFNSVHLHIQEEDLSFLRKYSGLSEKSLIELPFQPNEIGRIMKTIHKTTLSTGFPFSKVHLEKINFSGRNLEANLIVNKGKFYSFSDIHIKGDSSISSIFISSLIDIKVGDKFNEIKLSEITKKLSQLSFLKELKPHELLFTETGVELFLYLKSNPVSSINGAVGLQPNPATSRIGLTGELNLKLLNILKHGELLNVNWRSIQAQTQSLNAVVNYPFLFKTPFGIDGQFQLYKRDTTFIELKSTIGVQYFLRGGNYIKVFYQNLSSSILNGGANNPTFSNLSMTKTNAYGISFLRRQLDYLPNPSKGIGLQLEVAIGSRKSQPNDTTNWVKATTYKAAMQFDWFIPLTRRNVIRIANKTDFYYATQIFQNEVFRFGGQNSLRGFNEEELYATVRSVLSIEYRFLLDRNSHVFAFFDQGFYENSATSYYHDNPYGFGLGFSFGTNLGIFSISYALGKQFDNPILMRNGKIHFGYIAYF